MPELTDFDLACVCAPNPSSFTLRGTNTWLVGRDPTWVIDPGPEIASHVGAVAEAVAARGGAGGIAVTHRHPDHVGAVASLRAALGGPPVAAFRGPADVLLTDGDALGPLRALYLPGHAEDHLVFLSGGACFTGDALLGEGSVFVTSGSGGLRAYLAGLRRLRALALAVICPGHGPTVWDPAGRLDEYLEHRMDRERRLLAGLDAGARSVDELLDAAWEDVPAVMRPAAAVTLAAHLEKLREEGRLPDGVEEPLVPAWARAV